MAEINESTSLKSIQATDKSSAGFMKLFKKLKPAINDLLAEKSYEKSNRISEFDQLKFSKDSFAKILMDGNLFVEFKDFIETDGGQNYLIFFETFTRLELYITDATRRQVAPKVSPNHHHLIDPRLTFPSMGRFLESKAATQESSCIDIPSWLVSHFLIFYSTFITSGAIRNVYLSTHIKKAIAKEMENGLLQILKSNIFDDAADEVLNTLYTSWFPRFLAAREDSKLPILSEKLLSTRSATPVVSFVTVSATKRKLASEGKGFIIRRRNSADTMVYTRECFVRTLYDQGLYKEFTKFVAADHCIENLMFLESYSKLEYLLSYNTQGIAEATYTSVGKLNPEFHPFASSYTRSMIKFLRFSDTDSSIGRTTSPTSPVSSSSVDILNISPWSLSQLFMFYSMFISTGAPHEVNIMDKTRRKIAECLSQNEGCVVNLNVFDDAVDEVMHLLYVNTFKRFVSEKAHIKDKAQRNSKDISKYKY